MRMWEIREEHKEMDTQVVHGNVLFVALKMIVFLCLFDDFVEGYPTAFSIELRHGGKSTKYPNRRYIQGKLCFVDMVDMEEFSVHDLDDIIQVLGYDGSEAVYYHYLLPNGDLDFGVRPLGNDIDVINLSKYVEHNKLIRIYTEHGQTKLVSYFLSPTAKPRVIIEEEPDLEDVPIVNQDGQRPDMSLVVYGTPDNRIHRRVQHGQGSSNGDGSSKCIKRLCYNVGDVGAADQPEEVYQPEVNVNLGAADQPEEVYQPEVNVNLGAADQLEVNVNMEEDDFYNFDPFFGQEAKDNMGSTNNQEANDNMADMSRENEEEDESDGGYEYNDEGESEGSGYDSENGNDSDYLVDEENYLSDVEVDMNDFHMCDAQV